MFDDFYVEDRWTKQPVHCVYQALIMAIATRHADAIDVKFLVQGRPVWNRLTGQVMTDPLAVQTAGHYLKTAIESGLDNGREMYTLSVDETLYHMRAALIAHNAPKNAIPNLETISN
jgi:hypothetical protein